MQRDSMMFGGVDLRSEFGIIVETVERPFFANLRACKVQVPDKSGMLDYGSKYHDEITLMVKCGTISLLTQAQVRELVYALSEKQRIVFWDEPDKYYIGRLYSPGNIAKEVSVMRKFTLPFICDPYAYGQTVDVSFAASISPQYNGTAEAPTRLEIKNIGSSSISGIHITVTRRKETY